MAHIGLMEFIESGWNVLEPGRRFVPGWHIQAIVEHLEAVSRGHIRNLVVNMPPRHMKSLTVSVFWPAWEWTFRPEGRWLFASYSQHLSTRDSLKCRRLIVSPWYQERWGEQFSLVRDQNAKTRFENSRTGSRIATSVGGFGTGEGGDRVVVDDPHNVMEGESAKMRKAALEWWDLAMSTRLNDPETGARVIVMQRIHQRDLAGHVLKQGGYHHLCLPAEYEGRRVFSTAPEDLPLMREDPRAEEGELLWPKRFGRTAIDELKRALGSFGAAGQLQQRPAPAGGGVFKRSWWRFFRLAPQWRRMVQSWDTAFKVGEKNAYSVGQTWAEANDGYYLLDQVRDRMEYPELKRAVAAFYDKWRPQAVLVEDKASGQSLVQELRRGTRLPLLPVAVPDQDKVLRAHTVSPLVESGRVLLPEDEAWVSDFLDEMNHFPNAAHTDQVDAMTQALHFFISRRRRNVPRQRHY